MASLLGLRHAFQPIPWYMQHIFIASLITRCSTSPQWHLEKCLYNVHLQTVTPSPQQYQQNQSQSRIPPPSQTPFNSATQRFKSMSSTAEDSPGWVTERHTHTHSSDGTKLTRYFVMQSWGLHSRCSHKQKSELAHVLWEARLVPAASAGEEVIQGEGGWRKTHFVILWYEVNYIHVKCKFLIVE